MEHYLSEGTRAQLLSGTLHSFFRGKDHGCHRSCYEKYRKFVYTASQRDVSSPSSAIARLIQYHSSDVSRETTHWELQKTTCSFLQFNQAPGPMHGTHNAS